MTPIATLPKRTYSTARAAHSCRGQLFNRLRLFFRLRSTLTYLRLVFSSIDLSLFLSSHDTHHVDLFRYSIKWSGLPGTTILDGLRTGPHAIFPPPPPLLNPKARLYAISNQIISTPSGTPQYGNLSFSGRPPPFYIGALSCMDRGMSSASIPLACGHAFTADYSDVFRKNAGDNTLCPCNFINEARDLAPASPHHSYDRFMHRYLVPSPASPASPRTHLPRNRRQRPRPRGLFRNTTGHVLFQCPLYDSPRRCIFGLHANDTYIFGTEEGGRKLGAFLRTTNCLLPRPDPP